jgi:hypothetical protein
MIDPLIRDSLVGILLVAALTACYEMARSIGRRRRLRAEALKKELADQLSKAAHISALPKRWKYHYFHAEFGEIDSTKETEAAQWRVPLGRRITKKWQP